MRCSSKTKVDCGSWEKGICISEIKCPMAEDRKETNYEAIIVRTPEEMAELIAGDEMAGILDTICKTMEEKWHECEEEENPNCKACVLQWLLQERE